MVPDLSLIQGAVTGLKTAYDLTQTLIGLKVGAEVNAKAIELQQAVMAAQSSAFAAQSQQFAMLEEIRGLKEEIAHMKAWEEEKQRYKLTSLGEGTVTYALKKESSRSEPAHWICTNCYEDSQRSILQPGELDMRRRVYRCPRCKAQIRSPSPEPRYAT